MSGVPNFGVDKCCPRGYFFVKYDPVPVLRECEMPGTGFERRVDLQVLPENLGIIKKV